MKLWEALKIHEETGRKIRPSCTTIFELPTYWSIAACGLDGWDVEPAKVEVTREKMEAVCESVFRSPYNPGVHDIINDICKGLGL